MTDLVLEIGTDAEIGDIGYASGDLLEVCEEAAQEITELRSKSVVEAGAKDGLIGRCLVDTLKRGDRAGFAVHGEARDKLLDEHGNVDFRWR